MSALTNSPLPPNSHGLQFHGSCIMLMHWSLLNYAAVAKILKKHDKRTGLLLRAPYLSNVLQQVGPLLFRCALPAKCAAAATFRSCCFLAITCLNMDS